MINIKYLDMMFNNTNLNKQKSSLNTFHTSDTNSLRNSISLKEEKIENLETISNSSFVENNLMRLSTNADDRVEESSNIESNDINIENKDKTKSKLFIKNMINEDVNIKYLIYIYI
jgi:hypothetical protein